MLIVDNVSKNFGGILAVDSISFQIGAGEIVGLIGPNGAGKSTVLEVISGFCTPSAGSVVFNGSRIDGLPPHRVFQKGLTRSFQLAEFFPSFTVFDTILLPALHSMPLPQAHERAREIVRLLQIDAIARKPVCGLVPADQKRVEMGRILSSHPRMVLLDEIMAGLTEFEAKSVLSLIKQLNKGGMTFLIVEHRLELLSELCNRIIAIDFGRKIADGRPHEVMSNQEVVRAYLGKEV